jgi:hypothetical protein
VQIDDPEAVGLAQGLGKAVLPDHVGEIHQRALDRGD